MESPIVEVAAALIFRSSRLLIAQRPSGVHLPGLWEFPGGKRESDESFVQCLMREIREELDCSIKVGEIVFQTRHAYPEKTVDIQFFRCRIDQGEPRPIECAALEWVTSGELDRFAFPEADARLLTLLKEREDLWEP